MRTVSCLALGVVLAGCAAMPKPAPLPPAAPPAPVPAPPPPSPPPADWRDRAFAEGVWTLAADPDGPAVQFGRAGLDTEFRVQCLMASKSILFSRAGSLPAGAPSSMTVASTEASKSYGAISGGAPPRIWAETSVTDMQLDALAFSRGRILVAAAGTDDLVLPSWPEFAHVVEQCRIPEKTPFSASPQPSQSDAKIN